MHIWWHLLQNTHHTTRAPTLLKNEPAVRRWNFQKNEEAEFDFRLKCLHLNLHTLQLPSFDHRAWVTRGTPSYMTRTKIGRLSATCSSTVRLPSIPGRRTDRNTLCKNSSGEPIKRPIHFRLLANQMHSGQTILPITLPVNPATFRLNFPGNGSPSIASQTIIQKPVSEFQSGRDRYAVVCHPTPQQKASCLPAKR